MTPGSRKYAGAPKISTSVSGPSRVAGPPFDHPVGPSYTNVSTFIVPPSWTRIQTPRESVGGRLGVARRGAIPASSWSFSDDGQANEERRSHAHRRLEPEFPTMHVLDDGPREREPLPDAAADLLRREERVEDALSDGLGDPGPGVGDGDDDALAVEPGSHADGALAVAPVRSALDRVGGVRDEVEEHLLDVVRVARDEGQLAKLGLQLGELLVFATGRRHRALDGAIQVHGDHRLPGGPGELVQGTDNRHDAIEALEAPVEGLGNRGEQVGQVGLFAGLCGGGDRALELRRAGTPAPQGLEDPELLDDPEDIADGLPEELDAVGHELNGGVDLVRDTRREDHDGGQSLGDRELGLHPSEVGHVLRDDDGADDSTLDPHGAHLSRKDDPDAVGPEGDGLVGLRGPGLEDGAEALLHRVVLLWLNVVEPEGPDDVLLLEVRQHLVDELDRAVLVDREN